MSLIEVIIASAVVLFLSVVLINANLVYLKTSNINLNSIKAAYLAEEGVEVVNYLANDWDNLGAINTDYYLFWDGQAWLSTTTKSYIDQKFERSFVLEEVNRDSNDDIVLTGGVLDVNTRKVTVQISWPSGASTTTKSISSYIFKSND